MKQIGGLLKLPTKKKGSEKGAIITELFRLYTSENSRLHTQRDNWNGYKMWLMEQNIPATKRNVMDKRHLEGFRKSPSFIKERSIKSFAIGLSKHSKSVLYEILSVAKDKENRRENVGAYIGSNFWVYS